MSFSFRAVGLRESAAILSGAFRRGRDLTPAMRAGGERMLRSVEKNFRAGGRPVRWKPSARARAGGKTLIGQGRLRNAEYRAGRRSLTVGSNLVYAAVHQFGVRGTQRVSAHTRRITQAFGKSISPKNVKISAHSRKQNIPARPFILAQPDDRKYIEQQIKKRITGEK